jgi:hypothetical protein
VLGLPIDAAERGAGHHDGGVLLTPRFCQVARADYGSAGGQWLFGRQGSEAPSDGALLPDLCCRRRSVLIWAVGASVTGMLFPGPPQVQSPTAERSKPRAIGTGALLSHWLRPFSEAMTSALGHPLLERLDAALVGAVPSTSIAIHGEWTPPARRLNQSKVVDQFWRGRLTADVAFTGMAFLHDKSRLYWAKSAHVSREVDVSVSFHAHAGDDDGAKTFSTSLADVRLPGVPVVAKREELERCLVARAVVPGGRVVCLARCDGNAFFVLLFVGESIKFGRNRLWRAREGIAGRLAPDLAELLTRRRAGFVRPAQAP